MPRFYRIYVGNLPDDIQTREVEDAFSKYGRIRQLDVKNSRPPCYAFIEYDDDRDADDAVYGMDGKRVFGGTLRVEPARDRDRRDDRGGYGGYGAPRGGGGRGGGREPGPPRKGPSSTGYRLRVDGLPSSASWQDLKDHVRKYLSGVKPAFTQVYDDRGISIGIVEFESKDELDEAYDKLHKTEFSNKYDRACVVTVEIDDDTGRGDGGRSGGRGRSRSRSRSPRRDSRSRSRGRSKSRSKSPAKSRSPSRGRSPAKDM